MGGISKQTFLQRWHTDCQEAQERFSASLIVTEIHIQTTVRYHLTPVRIAIIKKLQTKYAREGAKKRDSCYTVGGNVN